MKVLYVWFCALLLAYAITGSDAAIVRTRHLQHDKKPSEHFLVIVLAKDRPGPLRRLLISLDKAIYNADDDIRLEIHIDYGNNAAHKETVSVAHAFNFTASHSKTHVVHKPERFVCVSVCLCVCVSVCLCLSLSLPLRLSLSLLHTNSPLCRVVSLPPPPPQRRGRAATGMARCMENSQGSRHHS